MDENNECAICLDNTIDIKNNCSCCKNGICNSCCNKLIAITITNLNDIGCYICPFCKVRNYKKWTDTRILFKNLINKND